MTGSYELKPARAWRTVAGRRGCASVALWTADHLVGTGEAAFAIRYVSLGFFRSCTIASPDRAIMVSPQGATKVKAPSSSATTTKRISTPRGWLLSS